VSRGSDPWPPRRISALLDAAAGSGPLDPELAAAIESASAELPADERAIIGRFLERAIATIARETVEIERHLGEDP
jgi:hypothetical protein